MPIIIQPKQKSSMMVWKIWKDIQWFWSSFSCYRDKPDGIINAITAIEIIHRSINLFIFNILSKNEVVRKAIPTKLIQGKCSPCNSRRNNLCCKQVLPATTFRSAKTNKEFKIFHKLNCKSVNVIYLLECNLHHIQYIGKSETPFNIRLNNHRKDVKNPNSIPACKHFNEQGHIYERDAKFILIEQLRKDLNKEWQSATLKRRKNFWINKLKTLYPNGLNQELNQV